MIVRIRCECGQLFGVDNSPDALEVRCPNCNRVHVTVRDGPGKKGYASCSIGSTDARPEVNSHEREKTRQSRAWLASLAGLLGVVLICLATLWAITVPTQDRDNTADQEPNGNVKGAGSMDLGDRTGRGLAGEGSDPGRTEGTQVSTAPSAPTAGHKARSSDGPGASGRGSGEVDSKEDSELSVTPNAELHVESNRPDSSSEEEHVSAEEDEEQQDVADGDGQREQSEDTEESTQFSIDLTLGGSDSPVVGNDGKLGARGTLGARGKRRCSAGRKYGATKESEAAVDAGLAWLARQQQEDGSWTGPTVKGNGYPLGCTGLAVLAFLGAGYTHELDGPYKETVRNGLNWILSQERDETGAFRFRKFYEQGISVWALCEALVMTHDARLRRPAQRTSSFIVSQMGPGGGYGYNGPGDDTHVTSFQIMALKSSMLAEINVPPAAVAKLKAYLDRSIGVDGTTGYTSAHRGGKVTGARTSAGLLCRLFLGYGRDHAAVLKTAELIHRTGPQVSDVFYNYNATYCMFHMGGAYWDVWNPPFRDGVVAMQIKDGAQSGSWQGDILLTTLYVMSLEVYYRYLPVYK